MSNRGFTLIEILVTVGILGIIALVAIPAMQPYDEENLDVAAQEVAAAIRFARDEAVRTGNPYGIYVSALNQRLRVYRLDTSGPPTVVYDVRNPLDKKLYDLQFATDPDLSGVTISAVLLYFRGSVIPRTYIGFDRWATPKYNDSGTIRMLNDGRIKLASRGAERVVKVHSMTGRVTVN